MSISTYLKEYYKDKPSMTSPGITDKIVNFEQTNLLKILKRILLSSDTQILPIFYISQRDELKDESKQLLTFT